MILINYLMFREIIPEKLLLKISYFWPFFANFLVLDRKLIWMALFWAVTLNFWVAPSWLKTYFESIFSLFLDLTCLDWFSELRILCIYIFLEMSFALASPFYCLFGFKLKLLTNFFFFFCYFWQILGSKTPILA